jgi:tetratricopeptide (TPR) repeat protein
MKKRTLVFGSLAVLLLGAGAGGYLWQRAEQRAEIFSAAVPVVPDISNWPEPFRRRIETAERRLATEPLEALSELSRLYHANGFFTEATQCYGGLERLQPEEPRWPHLHATILSGYGDNEPALRLWLRAVKLAPDYVPARLRLGDVYLKLSNRAAAAETYRAVLADHPREPYARLGVARCEFDAGRWENARQLLEPLVAETNYMLGYDLIVTVYEQLGRQAEATAIRARMRESGAYRDPVDPWNDELANDCYDVYRLSLASGSAQRNSDFPLAYRRIEQALALAPDQATLHYQLGNLNKNTKAYSKARQNYELCAQLKPDFPDAWIELSIACETLGDRAAGDRAMIEGLKRCPASPGLLLLNARRLVREEHLEESIPLFRESIRLRPNEADAYLFLTAILTRLGRTAEAIECVDGALRAEPDHPGALGIRAFHAVLSEDEASAREWIRRLQNQPRTRKQDLDRILTAYRERFGRDYR